MKPAVPELNAKGGEGNEVGERLARSVVDTRLNSEDPGKNVTGRSRVDMSQVGVKKRQLFSQM